MARILGIGTINVAVASADDSARRFEQLGFSRVEDELTRLPARPAQINFFTIPVGNCSISLVEASDETSPIQNFLDRRGEGLFSINMKCDDLAELMVEWEEAGVRWLLAEPLAFDPNPERPRGGRANWVHPSTLNGLLIEVIEEA